MATYNKRGYRTPKEKEVKEIQEIAQEATPIDNSNSTTAEVFSKLDETASKTEDWIAKNQNVIFGIVGAIALATIGYMGYKKFIAEPNEVEAADVMYAAQQDFQTAVNGSASADSLYTVALNGAADKLGFIKIANEYAGTNAGNLANYYSGVALLNTGKFKEAIEYLEKFDSDDMIISNIAKGAIGDAYSELNNNEEALEYYIKASSANENELTTPKYLLKAAKTALALGKKEDALEFLNKIKDNYADTPEANVADQLIGLTN
jgi:tetratricopeptide (TPR) repeat protein